MGNELNSAKKLTALELNNIKLDPMHTVLTPQYLENLKQNRNPEKESNP